MAVGVGRYELTTQPLGLGGASRLTGVLVLQRAEFRDLLWDVWTTLLRSRQLYLDSPIGSKLSTYCMKLALV